MSVTTTSSTPPGSYTVTITGTSGSLQNSTTATLVVNAAATGGGTPVNLSSAYNRMGLAADGTTFSTGLDQRGNAYSATLLGSAVSFNGNSYPLGPANALDTVFTGTVPLPAGQYASLSLLATAVNGNQTSQTFTVTYSDGTTSMFTQSLSDWYTPQNYPGESTAATMAYRDLSNGTKDDRTFNLYGYSFALNSAKTVSSVTLPNNSNVGVLSMILIP